MNREIKKQGNGWALLPFLIFIVIYLGAGFRIVRRFGVMLKEL